MAKNNKAMVIHVPLDLLARVDAAAESAGKSRAEYVRWCLETVSSQSRAFTALLKHVPAEALEKCIYALPEDIRKDVALYALAGRVRSTPG